MNRAVSGTLTVQETGRPLPGLRVVAARLMPGGVELLGATISGDYGRFRIAYEPLIGAADLTLLVFAANGQLLYREPVHRAITGAELNLRVAVPTSHLLIDLH